MLRAFGNQRAADVLWEVRRQLLANRADGEIEADGERFAVITMERMNRIVSDELAKLEGNGASEQHDPMQAEMT